MQTHIYKSLKKAGTYLYLPAAHAPDRLPDALGQTLAPWQFVLALTLTPDSRLASEDPSTVLAHLAGQGYHLQWPPVPVQPEAGQDG